MPATVCEGVVKASRYRSAAQMQQRRGRACRSAVDRTAASPCTPFPRSRQTWVAWVNVSQCCKRAHSSPPVGQYR
eukprot:164852-Alexandrium_andersonii.AAC.1